MEKNLETEHMIASAVVGVASLFGSLMHSLLEAATKERVYIEKQVNIYKNVYYVPAGQDPYHLGFEENPAIKNHRKKQK